MAGFKPIRIVEDITGKLNKSDDVVFRRKIYRDEQGRIMGLGKREAYRIDHPRDWEKNPATGAELAKIERWRESCQRSHLIFRPEEQILADETLTDEQKQQALATRRAYKERFDAQRRKGEADAPIDKKTHRRKTYQRFDTFVRAVILRELQAAAKTTE